MANPSLQPSPISPRSSPAAWVIAALLAIIAVGVWLRPARDWLPAALAQNQPLAGARGIFAFTGQIDHNRFGLFMLDVDQGTIWCYELDSVGGARKLRLIAARTFLYDRYLQDFNCAAPDFRMVRELVEQQRTRAATDADPRGGNAGAVDAPPSRRDDN